MTPYDFIFSHRELILYFHLCYIHGTVTAIYQRKHSTNVPNTQLNLKLARDRSLKNLPPMELIPCYMTTNMKPQAPNYLSFKVGKDSENMVAYHKKDLAWLVSHSITYNLGFLPR
jgi:hypothetical protein